jgi:type IV pilus modification protein PilV
MKLNTTHKYFSKLNGFGLVEALIGSLIIATGLLGLISLQSTSFKSVQRNYYTTTAAILAQEMIMRMQLNAIITSNGYQAGGNNNYLQLFVSDPIDVSYAGDTQNWYTAWYAALSGSCYSGASFCTPFTAASTDKAELAIQTWNQLPSGRIKVCFDSANAGTFTCDNNVTNAQRPVGTSGQSVFTVKMRWTNIATGNYEYYETKFTYSCTNTLGC